jgi:hypothetical protein
MTAPPLTRVGEGKLLRSYPDYETADRKRFGWAAGLRKTDPDANFGIVVRRLPGTHPHRWWGVYLEPY